VPSTTHVSNIASFFFYSTKRRDTTLRTKTTDTVSADKPSIGPVSHVTALEGHKDNKSSLNTHAMNFKSYAKVETVIPTEAQTPPVAVYCCHLCLSVTNDSYIISLSFSGGGGIQMQWKFKYDVD
jgi:hypothetical protein